MNGSEHSEKVNDPPLNSARKFTHDSRECKVVVIGKGGFSSSPLIVHGFLKDAGYHGTKYNSIVFCDPFHHDHKRNNSLRIKEEKLILEDKMGEIWEPRE
jgi:hypothetical protein